MTEKTIINGFEKDKICNLSNCNVYKQLKRKEQECEKLKIDNKEQKRQLRVRANILKLTNKKNNELKQALQDIKKITVTLKADICSYCDSKDTDRCEQTDIDELEQILQKCEVLDEQN